MHRPVRRLASNLNQPPSYTAVWHTKKRKMATIMATSTTGTRKEDRSERYVPSRYRVRAGAEAGRQRSEDAASFHAIDLGARSVDEVIGAVKEGLAVERFDELQEQLGVTAKELAAAVQIAERTLHRRRKQGRLSTDESERVLRIARLFDRAVRVLGSADRARTWLKTPLVALGGKTPFEYADTEPGAREVEHVLGRIAYGVFS